MQTQKKQIRKEIFKRRREAQLDDIKNNSHLICEALKSLPEYQKAEWIYVYIDCKNEVMTGEIMDAAYAAGKKVACPKVVGEDMIFYEINSRDDLEPGYFDILEPKAGLTPAQGEDGLLVMPGVAFDQKCHRVGYGGGFYDRYLSVHTKHYKAALAFEFQMMDGVPVEETDILPDVVITEKQIYHG